MEAVSLTLRYNFTDCRRTNFNISNTVVKKSYDIPVTTILTAENATDIRAQRLPYGSRQRGVHKTQVSRRPLLCHQRQEGVPARKGMTLFRRPLLRHHRQEGFPLEKVRHSAKRGVPAMRGLHRAKSRSPPKSRYNYIVLLLWFATFELMVLWNLKKLRVLHHVTWKTNLIQSSITSTFISTAFAPTAMLLNSN